MKAKGENPCRTCGACCAYFRVSFYWGETDKAPGGYVPSELTAPLPPFYHLMRGTDRNPPRCIALEGEVGHSVRCRIYERRPSPCRDFGVQWRNGRVEITPEMLERCNQARMAWGLPPLSVETQQTCTSLSSKVAEGTTRRRKTIRHFPSTARNHPAV